MSTKTTEQALSKTRDSLNASIDIVAIALDSSIAFYYNDISKKGILNMYQREVEEVEEENS